MSCLHAHKVLQFASVEHFSNPVRNWSLSPGCGGEELPENLLSHSKVSEVRMGSWVMLNQVVGGIKRSVREWGCMECLRRHLSHGLDRVMSVMVWQPPVNPLLTGSHSIQSRMFCERWGDGSRLTHPSLMCPQLGSSCEGWWQCNGLQTHHVRITNNLEDQ